MPWSVSCELGGWLFPFPAFLVQGVAAGSLHVRDVMFPGEVLGQSPLFPLHFPGWLTQILGFGNSDRVSSPASTCPFCPGLAIHLTACGLGLVSSCTVGKRAVWKMRVPARLYTPNGERLSHYDNSGRAELLGLNVSQLSISLSWTCSCRLRSCLNNSFHGFRLLPIEYHNR